ncbi:MAG: LuxR C-terminal-related transcriptional regulator [Candidatus Nanopelagicales bacterium]|nr:LuxR C-terminal-related transcriptional regulator [Candidatus Nanopelagicales bacterium]
MTEQAAPVQQRPSRAPSLRARIQVPQLPEGVVERQALLDRLDAELRQGGVLLLRAAAGFGKTTLLAQWAQRPAAEGRAVAWVTCTERADDPAALFVDVRDALALALRDAAPRASAQLLELAVPSDRSTGSEVEALLMLLDDLPTPPVLVLDDLHTVRASPSLALLEALVLGLPAGVGLALGTRAEPRALLTALRLGTRLVEVTEVELALTRAEVAQVVGEAGGDPGTLTHALLAQTEGWPAAVRLGVLAAHNARPDWVGLRLSDDPSMADFLDREIEAVLPLEAVALLRATAVVSELSPRLAAALSGRPDAGAILEQLFRTQALVRRTGGAEPTFVVHTLVRAHLLASLAAGDVDAPARQHAAAARWLADAGQPERALDHAVAARDPELTAALLRLRAPRLLVAGRMPALVQALATIPPSHWDPDLVGLAALTRAAQGDLAGARGALLRGAALTAAGQAVPSARAPAGAPSLLRVAEFHVRRLEGSPQAPDIPEGFADVLAWQADAAPGDADLDRQLILLVTRGQWEFATGRYEASWDDLRLALDLATTHRRDHLMLLAMSTLSAVPALMGDAAGADRYVGEVLSRIEDRGWATHPAMANVFAVGAWAASLGLLPERAEQMIAAAHEALHGNVDPEYATYTALVDATLAATRFEDPTPALALLARLAEGGPGAELTPALRAFPAMQRVRIRLARGDLPGAQDAAADFERWFPGTGDPLIARAQTHAAAGRWEPCLADLREVTGRSLPVAVPVYEVVLPMLESVAEERLGRRSHARGALLRAMAVAAPRGVMRPFSEAGPVMRIMLERQRGRFGGHDDFVDTILQRWDAVDAAGHGRSPIRADGDGIALTPRELEVLRALPSLMTAEELASAQTVSVNTIRTHMRSLFRKLGVRTRRDAVRRARELGLL